MSSEPNGGLRGVGLLEGVGPWGNAVKSYVLLPELSPLLCFIAVMKLQGLIHNTLLP